MAQKNMDIGVLQKTKVMEEIYMRELAGYRVVAANALRP